MKMCGRFALAHSEEDLIQEYQAAFVQEEPLAARYNIAPTQNILAIPADEPRQFQNWQWGLVPVWAKDLKRKPLINVRSDTLAQKSYFRVTLSRRRCLIPVSGFYEWREADNPKEGGKTPIYFQSSGSQILSLAGLWEERVGEKGKRQTTCAIITTEPNTLAGLVHDRMPVLLPPDALDIWLDPSVTDAVQLLSLLVPSLDSALRAFPVERAVNSAAHDGPDCIEPAGPPLALTS